MKMSTPSQSDNNTWIKLRTLGSGAFGVVELWKNENTQENVAIKRSQAPFLKTDHKQWARWEQEVQIMCNLNHPNIVETKQIPDQIKVTSLGLPILCMEYCAKGDLRKVLNNHNNFCGVKSEDGLKIMSDISSAVEYLHNHGITHRDLKPENIILQESKNEVVYKIIDLGYGKTLGDESTSASLVGTLNYVAPELLWKETYSCSVDYWSLGILFYEILTGIRPFLPTMQLTEKWMRYVKSKKYEHISAREVSLNKIIFNTDFEEPHRVPECIKDDLVQWFRVVLQWDPKQRGKLPTQEESKELVVFSMLKLIINKKILSAFIVSNYKFVSFLVDSDFTMIKFKQLIAEKEGIGADEQILMDSEGNELSDSFFSTAKSSKFILVFHSSKLCVEIIPKPVIPKIIEEMIIQPRKECDYFHLRRYYGATIDFMKRELELYRTYILALSSMIDLCDTKFKSLQNDVFILSAGVESLSNKKLVPNLNHIKDRVVLENYTLKFNRLKTKINKYLEGTKQVIKNFNNLAQRNEKLKGFSDINWITNFSEPYDNALELINKWQASDRNQRYKPFDMVDLFLNFLVAKVNRLQNPQLLDAGRDIMQFLKQLIKFKAVFKSFEALLSDYLLDINAFYDVDNYTKDIIVESSKNVHNNISNTVKPTNTPQGASESTDVIIYNSIFTRNMLGGLLIEMDIWKRRFTDLN